MPYTLVLFHAHPDDEAIATGGTMARFWREGHRAVLVVSDPAVSSGSTLPTRWEPGEQSRGPARLGASTKPQQILGVDRGRAPWLPRLWHGR